MRGARNPSGHSLVVERQPSKLNTGVRFSLPAQFRKDQTRKWFLTLNLSVSPDHLSIHISPYPRFNVCNNKRVIFMSVRRPLVKLVICLAYIILYWLIYITLALPTSLPIAFLTLYLFVFSLQLSLYYFLVIVQDKWLPTKIKRLDLILLSFVLLPLCAVPVAHLFFGPFGDAGLFILLFFFVNSGVFLCYYLPTKIWRVIKTITIHN